LVDDYQRTGSGPLDVHALGVDFLVTGAYKYLLGPAGVAFLYVRRALIERLTPTVTGWFGRVAPFDYAVDRLDWSATARRFETGTPAVAAVYGVHAALRLLGGLPAGAIGDRIASLVRRLRRGIEAANYATLTPADPRRHGPLTVVASTDGPELVRRLRGRGVVCSARGNGLRIAVHAYNDENDVDAVLHALAEEETLLARAATPAAHR
jgi:selenocysteine lyase/cysteine desulfurase